MCSATLANTCEYIYFQASQTHPQEFHFWNTSEMIICCRDKNMIQIVKQQEKFCMLACHTLSPEKFMVPQDLQVESQDIPVLNTVPGTGGCALSERCWNLYKPLKCLFLKKKKKHIHTKKQILFFIFLLLLSEIYPFEGSSLPESSNSIGIGRSVPFAPGLAECLRSPLPPAARPEFLPGFSSS